MRAKYKPADGKEGQRSLETATKVTNESRVRHEMAHETKIETILQRYGAQAFGQPQRGTVEYIDYDLDREGIIEVARRARDVYDNADPSVRGRYPTMEEFMAAIDSGEVEIITEEDSGGLRSTEDSSAPPAGSKEPPVPPNPEPAKA